MRGAACRLEEEREEVRVWGEPAAEPEGAELESEEEAEAEEDEGRREV